jgi:chitin disaccharide deacetylase
MLIVLNADDFGVSEETVHATIACFEAGALTSATIMPGMPATAAALEYARSRPDCGFGVHLLLSGDGEEQPSAEGVPGLTGPDGAFLGKRDARMRALTRRFPGDELDRELAAQIELVLDAGVTPSHVDSHRHLHKIPSVRRALERVLPRHGITRVRNVQNVFLGRPLTSPTYWLGPFWGRGVRRGFTTTDHFYMPSGSEDAGWPEPLLNRLHRLDGSLEVGVHPGPDGWRRAERDGVLSFAERARERGHRLADWRAVS